jgi:pSer/pThr/pTyr-binding forkhead associated (FHA) protein
MKNESMDPDSRESRHSTIINPEDGRIRPAGVLTKRALLLVLSENLFGTTFVLDKSRVVVGRSSGCDIVLNDPLVSREHCAIESVGDGDYFLEDLGSKNATVLNRKNLTRRSQLFYGDRIVLGGTVLRFLLEERIERK